LDSKPEKWRAEAATPDFSATANDNGNDLGLALDHIGLNSLRNIYRGYNMLDSDAGYFMTRGNLI
jgi:hypothetical protein